MGASQSGQLTQEDQEEEEEEEDDDGDNVENSRRELSEDNLVKKVLEQEPEMSPCHAAASPLSPQLSSLGTPRLGPSIKVWDPYNVLAPPPRLPPPPPPPQFHRSFSSDSVPVECDQSVTEVYLISHGECHMNLRPDLVAGRCPDAALTPSGKRQARALAVLFKSQGIRFSAVYTSPLERARLTAISVSQEINFPEEQIQSSDALLDMNEGHWEGCRRSDIYTTEMLSLMDMNQPDFSAPSGESLRQVEFRMVQFLNGTIMVMPEKLRPDISPSYANDSQGFSNLNPHTLTNSIHEQDGPSLPAHHWDLLHKHKPGLTRKKSGKSRLQYVTTGDHEADDEMSPREPMNQGSFHHEINVRSTSSYASSSIGVFTHSVPIKCLLTGLLGCSPVMSRKICIEDSSVTVLQHSWKSGWQIKRSNDTAHLRLL